MPMTTRMAAASAVLIASSTWVFEPAVSVAGDPPAPPAAEAASDELGAKPSFPPGFVKEGPLPEGYPPPSAVGQVVEKVYPLSRTYSAEGNNAFMRCFAYLAKNKHEMTVPVIVDYNRRAGPDQPQPNADFEVTDVDRMHFVLEKVSLDQPKQEGPVTVADMPQMRVLSIAYQGPLSDERLADAQSRLEAELQRRQNMVAAGPKRVLGYNSPMVPRDKTYWEVQLPVRDKDPADAQ